MLLDKIKGLFEKPKEESETPNEDDLRLATAALLVEMARADFAEDPDEYRAILKILRTQYGVSDDEAQTLLGQAEARVDKSVSLHEFTSKLHQRLSAKDKTRIVQMMWEVALSDGHIDKYEDHLVRKVAELLYVNHAELVRLKHVVIEALGEAGPKPEQP